MSHFDEFLVSHLPNRYLGSWLGLDALEFHKQLEVLLRSDPGRPDKRSLLEPQTKVFHCEWSKDQYEPCRDDLIAMFPPGTRTVLSIGCGWGETEAGLARRGIEVTAIPLDSVIAACAEARKIKVVHGPLEDALTQLQDQQFDGVLTSGILHLLKDPAKVLCRVSSLLVDGGLLVATDPAFYRLPFLWLWFRHPSRYKGWQEFERSGVHPIGKRQLRTWFRNAGVSLEAISGVIPQRWKTLVAASGGMAESFFSSEYIFVGRRTQSRAKATVPSAVAREVEVEREMTCVVDRSSSR